ncbi:MAG TPA: hypothetical protein VFX75_04525 [Nitrososphaeraceae archaeon]|jgi:hypothetical protein|nr:hypothetical protein [Nitrososphaeraceae archaeon]
MINEFPEEYNNLEIVVSIKHVVEGALASKLSGHFLIYNNKFSFNAVAFGRIGGHNISVKISRTTSDKIRKLNLDPEIVILIVQRKIIEGDITIQTKRL